MKGTVAFAFLFGIAVSVLGQQIRYDNYKLYRFTPKDEQELKLVFQLQKSNPGVIFWQEPSHVGQAVDIMFPPHLQGDTLKFLTKRISAQVLNDNVQGLINKEAIGKLQRGKGLNWDSYGSLEDINEYLDAQAAAHPGNAQVLTIGKSYEERDMKLLKIAKPTKSGKPAIWLDAGIHGREWISMAVGTYVINELLNSDNEELKKIKEDFDIYVMPVLNPDGYVYSQTTDRMWRKTRGRTNSTLGCIGADPNRNWGYHFNTGGSSDDPCSIKIGRATAKVIAEPYGTQFAVGSIVNVLYKVSGSNLDWVKGIHNTSIVLAFELRDRGEHGFLLPPDQIKPSGIEFMEGFKELVRQLRDRLKMS